MVRIFFTYVLPLLAPSLLYLAWSIWKSRYQKGNYGPFAHIEKGKLFWCMIVGAICSGAILFTVAFTSGFDPNSEIYISPRLENGKVIDPIFKKK